MGSHRWQVLGMMAKDREQKSEGGLQKTIGAADEI